jgi:hypothetical protein
MHAMQSTNRCRSGLTGSQRARIQKIQQQKEQLHENISSTAVKRVCLYVGQRPAIPPRMHMPRGPSSDQCLCSRRADPAHRAYVVAPPARSGKDRDNTAQTIWSPQVVAATCNKEKRKSDSPMQHIIHTITQQ